MATPRVLVIDDSPTIRRVVGNVLAQGGYAVVAADSGEAGLKEAQALRPDLILLDFMMPGMNGYQFVKALDQTASLAECPVVLMVTRTDQVPEGALKSLGVVDTISKPFSPEAILAVVGYSLEKHGLKRKDEITRVTKAAEAAQLAAGLAQDDDKPSAASKNGKGAHHAVSKSVRLDAAAAAAVTDPNQRAATDLDDPAAVKSDDRGVFADTTVADVRGAALLALLVEELQARGVSDASDVAAAVVARVAEVGDPGDASAALRGDLAAVPLPEVLQLLKFQAQTGLLEVDLGGHSDRLGASHFEVGFKAGFIVSLRARGLRADLLLGRYFVSAGLLSAARVEELARERGAGPLGQRLVDAGHITVDELRRCVGEQASDLMYELLRGRRGTFSLRRGDGSLPQALVSPGFSVDGLLFESLRRIDEWSVIGVEVPSFDARFRRSALDEDGLAADELMVLRALPSDGAIDVHALLKATHMRAFEACKILYRLLVLKRARRVDDGPTHRLVSELPEAEENARDAVAR